MSLIRFSTGVAETVLGGGIFGSITSPYALCNNNSHFFIMQGTFPTAADLTNQPSDTWRTADRLIDFGSISTANRSVSGNVMTLASTFETTATASGTATWFWWVGRLTSSTSGTTAPAAMAGTISTPGNGGDLVMATTNIVAGNTYSLTEGIQFTLPLDF